MLVATVSQKSYGAALSIAIPQRDTRIGDEWNAISEERGIACRNSRHATVTGQAHAHASDSICERVTFVSCPM